MEMLNVNSIHENIAFNQLLMDEKEAKKEKSGLFIQCDKITSVEKEALEFFMRVLLYYLLSLYWHTQLTITKKRKSHQTSAK